MMTTEQEDEQDRRELARDIADRAIDRWKEALKEQATAYRLVGDLGHIDHWADLMTTQVMNASRFLILTILAFDPDYRTRKYRAEKRSWEPRGIRSNGKVYIAVPDDDGDGAAEKLDGPDVMRLIVVEESRIVDIERGGLPFTMRRFDDALVPPRLRDQGLLCL